MAGLVQPTSFDSLDSGIKVTGADIIPRVLCYLDEWVPKAEDFGINETADL